MATLAWTRRPRRRSERGCGAPIVFPSWPGGFLQCSRSCGARRRAVHFEPAAEQRLEHGDTAETTTRFSTRPRAEPQTPAAHHRPRAERWRLPHNSHCLAVMRAMRSYRRLDAGLAGSQPRFPRASRCPIQSVPTGPRGSRRQFSRSPAMSRVGRGRVGAGAGR